MKVPYINVLIRVSGFSPDDADAKWNADNANPALRAKLEFGLKKLAVVTALSGREPRPSGVARERSRTPPTTRGSTVAASTPARSEASGSDGISCAGPSPPRYSPASLGSPAVVPDQLQQAAKKARQGVAGKPAGEGGFMVMRGNAAVNFRDVLKKVRFHFVGDSGLGSG